MLENQVMLITGGTGTFGHAVLKRFLSSQVKEIRILSRDEKKQADMLLAYNDRRIKYYIGDVRSYDSIATAAEGVNLVYHAAALKQVPSCEFFPLEAIRTNSLGADNVMNAALACGVNKVIVLSTDKAVYPINAMGMSKALMEKLMIAKARAYRDSKTILCGTRYGNVMGSRGSVIPLFLGQIRKGEALTVTDPSMTRFMMSIDDAVELVTYAYSHGNPGDIFVQKAPAATIDVLIKALLIIFKVKNYIQIIGTRHGEKLYETLLTREEMSRAEDLGPYYRIPSDSRDLNYGLYFTDGKECISKEQDYNSHNTRRLNVEEMIEILLKLEIVQQELSDRR